MGKVYNLSFTEVLNNIKDYKKGTIIESQRGDKYKIEKTGNKDRKFTRIKNTKLRFMTYNNTRVNFRIVEENKQTDIQKIEEIKTLGCNIETNDGMIIPTGNLVCDYIIGKINEIIRVVNKTQQESKK